MADNIIVTKKTESFIKVGAEESILKEVSDHFTFFAKDYKYHPKFRAKLWDGKIRLFDSRTSQLYYGLSKELEKFAQNRGYPLDLQIPGDSEFSVVEALDFIDKILMINQETYKNRDYQIRAFIRAIRDKRIFLLSPTASGKSLIIYFILRYLLHSEYAKKILIVVPSTQLVEQLTSDFIDYGWKDAEKYIHKVYGGALRKTNKQVTISTWQSLASMPTTFFWQFDAMFGDEAHHFQANSLKRIMVNLVHAPYRIATSGTLDGAKIHEFMLQGLFGPILKVTTTKKLIDKGHNSQFQIKSIVLNYNKEVQKLVSGFSYPEEVNYIISNEKRNNFIKNLALSLEGNTLVLYRFIEKHGEILHQLINNQAKEHNKQVFYIHGGTETDIREKIRKKLEIVNNAVFIASFGTFSEGSNVKNLHNVIFAFPYKGQIKNMQSIGRVLRPHDSKKIATLFDISDDFRYGKRVNTTYNHFLIRKKLYAKEQLTNKVYRVNLIKE